MFSNDEMDFSELIQSYFLKRTGKGLIFSSRDLDLLLKWEKSGCSAGTVCKGIDAAVERANRIPRDLFACRKYIEEGMGVKKPNRKPQVAVQVKTNLSAEPQPANGPMVEREELVGIVKRYARQNPHGEFQSLYIEALKELADENLDIDVFGFEENFYARAFLSLPENKQVEIDDQILSKLNAVLSTMSPKARLATITAKRRAYLERKMSGE